MLAVVLVFTILISAFIVLLEIFRRTPQGKMHPLPGLICKLDDMVKDYLQTQEVQAARRNLETSIKFMPPPMEWPVNRQDSKVFSSTGKVDIRIYHRIVFPEAKDLPVCIFFHSGGFVVGNLETAEPVCLKLSSRLNILVISVDYPLAPEHPYPLALETVTAIYPSLLKEAARHGGDINKVWIAGASAGGNLALNLALSLQKDYRSNLKALILMYPWIDLSDTESASFRNFTEGYLLTKQQILWFRDLYLSRGQDPTDPEISPINSPLLSNLPPVLLYTAEFDILRDQGLHLAKLLRNASVPVRSILLKGHIHGFFSMPSLQLLEINRYLDEGKKFLEPLR